MPLLLVTTDPQLRAALELRAQAAGLDLQVQQSATDASAAMRAGLPDALLVDLPHRSRERLRLLDDTRRTYPAANIPIVLLKPPHAPADADEAALHLNRVVLPSDLDVRLRALIAAHQAPVPGQPHPYTLDTLARIWRQGLSGSLHLPSPPHTLSLSDGGIVDPDQLPLLEAALSAPGARFSEGAVHGLGDWLSVGNLLWQAACARTHASTSGDSFLKASGHLILKGRPSAERAALLPLSDETQQILADRRPLPLARLLSHLGLSASQVAPELEALVLLGLYRLHPAPLARPTQRARSALQGLPPPTTSPTTATATATAALSPGGVALEPEVQAQLERRRLQREAEMLAVADDWTVLGLQPTTEPERLREAGIRQQTRYSRLAQHHTDPEVRQAAQKILSRIEESLACLGSLQEIYAAYGEPSVLSSLEEVAFREGFAALFRRDLNRALRCFAAANDAQLQSPRNLAYLGWARYLQEGEPHLSESREMLQLSDSLSPNIPQTQLFLATLEADSGELARAEQRLSHLIRRGSAPEEAHSLFRRVRQQLAASAKGR